MVSYAKLGNKLKLWLILPGLNLLSVRLDPTEYYINARYQQ